MQNITLDNIRAYVEGHIKYSLFNYNLLDEYIIEQVQYRASKCPICVQLEECQDCNCKLPERLFVDKKKQHCNFTERLMNKENWEQFKKQNNININEIISKLPEGYRF